MRLWSHRIKYFEDGKKQLTGCFKTEADAKRLVSYYRELYGEAEVIDENAGEVWRYDDK